MAAMTPEERAAFVAKLSSSPRRRTRSRLPRLKWATLPRCPSTTRRLRLPRRKRGRLAHGCELPVHAGEHAAALFFQLRFGGRSRGSVPSEPQDAHAAPQGNIRYPAEAPLPEGFHARGLSRHAGGSGPQLREDRPNAVYALGDFAEGVLRRTGEAADGVRPAAVRAILEALDDIYGDAQGDVFDAIDPTPLGSASLAQVHKARLVTGEIVAVKIQRPGVKTTMAQDIDIMRMVARYAARFMKDEQMLDLRDVVEELWATFLEEPTFGGKRKIFRSLQASTKTWRSSTARRCTPNYAANTFS